MKLADSFRLSVNSILHRQLRSWLTLLGIIIGVAAVVSIISIGEGAQASVQERLSGLGADIITVSPGFSRAGMFGGDFRMAARDNGGGRGGQASSSSQSSPKMTKRDVAVIGGNPNVLQVNGVVSGRGRVVFLAESSSVSVEGVDPNVWKETSNLTLASGRFLTSSDAGSIVIGDRIANSMFKQPITLGRRITIQNSDKTESRPFTVVGILAASGSGGFGGGGGDSTVYLTQGSAWQVTDVNVGEFSSIQAKAGSAEVVEDTTTQLTDALLVSRRVTAQNQDFTITSAQAMQAQVSSVTDTLTLFLGAIAAVSLVVGAIGVANSMFTSVLEKTREIGILKALGSTNREILTLFIIESGLFGLVGGLIGVALGTLVSFGLGSIGIISIPMVRGGSSTLVTPQLVIIAVVLSTVIGVVAGVLPARAAARLSPVEALRYE